MWHISHKSPRTVNSEDKSLWEVLLERAAAYTGTGHTLLRTINMKRAKYIKQRMILIDTISKVIYRYWLFSSLNYTLKTGSLSIYFFKSLVAIHVNLLLFSRTKCSHWNSARKNTSPRMLSLYSVFQTHFYLPSYLLSDLSLSLRKRCLLQPGKPPPSPTSRQAPIYP